MADNTQISAQTTGDTIRDIDRGSAKTQVVQLDAGGEAGESLVSSGNPLPVSGAVSITGTPNVAVSGTVAISGTPGTTLMGATGDILAGVNVLERLIDGSLALSTKETALKLDPAGGLFTADMKDIPPKLAGAVTANWSGAIDTTGYGSFSIAFYGGSAAAQTQGSQDGITWLTIPVFTNTNTNYGATVAAVAFTAATPAYVYGACNLRYLRTAITSFTSGTPACHIILRATPVSGAGAGNVNATLTSNAVTAIGTLGAAGAPGNMLQVGFETVAAAAAALTNSKIYTPGLSTASQVLQKPYCSVEQDWMANGVITSSTAAVALNAAGAANIRNYCTGLQLMNSSATGTVVEIEDGSTVIWQTYLPASMTFPYTVTFNTPLHGTAATAMNIICGTSVASIYYSAQGYQSG